MKPLKKKRLAREVYKLLIDSNGLIVEKHKNHYYFNCNRNELGCTLDTIDIVEAVAALMRVPKLVNDEVLWDIPFDFKSNGTNADAILFWLSGGGNAYNFNSDIKWYQVSELYISYFANSLYYALMNCKTTGEIRDMLYNHFSTIDMCEFAIKNKLIAYDAV